MKLLNKMRRQLRQISNKVIHIILILLNIRTIAMSHTPKDCGLEMQVFKPERLVFGVTALVALTLSITSILAHGEESN